MSDAMDNAISEATVLVLKGGDDVAPDSISKDDVRTSNPVTDNFFQIENPSKASQEKMDYIFEWAKGEADSEENIDITRVLKDTRFRLGVNPVTSSYLDHFYRYTKMMNKSKDLQDQAKAMER